MKQTLKQVINRIFYRQRIRFHGKNNSFTYPKTANLKKLKIDVWGNNNKIIIADNVHLNNTHIAIGFANCKVENCTVTIGYKSSFNGLYLQIGEDNSTVSIGEKCMCSYGIEINCTTTKQSFYYLWSDGVYAFFIQSSQPIEYSELEKIIEGIKQ